MDLKSFIRDIPDFPKAGILFRDISPLLGNPDAFSFAIDGLAKLCHTWQPQVVAGIESRGFIFGVALAGSLKLPFVPLRKPGKLPGETLRLAYDLEYGSDALEVQRDALAAGQRAIVVDDLIATGGTAKAAGELVRQTGAELVGYGFAIELADLGGRDRLVDAPVRSLVRYD